MKICKKPVLLFSIITILCNAVAAQSTDIIKIANECSTPALKKNLYHLASNEMEGRLMASHGDTLASLFIADEFKKAGLYAPYAKSYFQAITATKEITDLTLLLGAKEFKGYEGWSVYPTTPVLLQKVPVVYNQFATLTALNDYINTADVKGKAITLCEPVVGELFTDNTDSIEAAWKLKGIVAVVWFGNRPAESINYYKSRSHLFTYKNELLKPTSQPAGNNNNTEMPEIALLPQTMNDLLAENNIAVNADGSFADATQQPVVLNNTLSLSVNTRMLQEQAPNVIGVLKGTDPSLPCIILSAHHDHDGKNGNDIYYGAVDNASGTVAIIEVANLLKKAAQRGLKPKRSIVFASFTGEERGLLGSTWYANHPVFPIDKTYGVINIDMMGRVDTFYSGKKADSSYAYYLVKDSLHQFRTSLVNANKALNELTLDARYEDPRYMQRRLRGSDQYPFYLKNIPFVRIDCGFSKDYHQLTDTPDKINYELLTKQVKLAFVTLWNMANE